MSEWLNASSSSNKLKQSYFQNFVDVSGTVSFVITTILIYIIIILHPSLVSIHKKYVLETIMFTMILATPNFNI